MQNINFITRKISILHLISQCTFGKQIILTSLDLPPRDPNAFFLQWGWSTHTQLSHLSRQKQWLLNCGNCCHQFVPPSLPLPFSPPHLELCFLILSSYLCDSLGGGGGRDRKSPVELCPEEQSTDTGIHLETSPQTWYTRILDCRGLKSFFFLLIWPPRSFSEVSQEPVLPAAGPQTLRKVVQGLCDCRANVQRVYSTENSTGRGSQFSI